MTIAGVMMGAGPHTVLDANYVIASLTLQNSSEVDTNNFLLAVEGHTQLSNADTRLQLFERTSAGDDDSLDTDTLSIGTGSFVEMYENSILEVDSGLFSVFGTLVGNGTVELEDNPATPTALLSIFGVVSAGQAGTFIGAPPPRTLDITATDPDARIGMSSLGLVEVQENATLINEVRMLNDNLANLRLGPNSTYQMDHSWHLTGDIEISTGPFSGTDPATIAAGQADLVLTLDSGSTVTVDADESLRFDIELMASNGSTVANSGTIIFDAPAQFGQMADLRMLGNFASLIVNAPVTITQDTFHLDGNDNVRNEITVNSGGMLTVDVDAIDISDNVADGTIAVNSGVLEVRTGSTGWTMNRRMTSNNSDGPPATVRNLSVGPVQTLEIGDGSGVDDAVLAVQGTGESVIDYDKVNFNSDANVDISSGAVLNLDGVTSFLSSDATFDGAGTLKPGLMRVEASTTLNIAVVDLEDGVAPAEVNSHMINQALTINADAIDDDGDGFDGVMTITNDLTTKFGELNVFLSAGQAASWSFDSGEIRLVGPDPLTAPNAAEMLDGSAIEVGTEGGTLVVEGWARSVARLDIYGTVAIVNDGDDIFVLDGGSQQNPNRLMGGLVQGAGTLHVGSNNALVGHGTIETSLQGTSNSRLVADDGTLHINGSIASFHEIEVTDDGVLDVESNWNTNDAGEVILSGGELTGATVIHDSFGGIHGYGLITAFIINNTFIRADSGETLIIEASVGASQLLDGVTGNGVLLAQSPGTLLHLRNDTSSILRSFSGTMRNFLGGQIHAENFRFRFTESSLMWFGDGGYSSNRGVEFQGEVLVNEGTSATLSVDQDAVFASTSTTTLDGELILDNGERLIESGASFSGIGSLVNAEGRLTTLSDGVGLAVAVINHGQLVVGNDSTDNELGTVELDSLTQSATGDLQIDLNGLGAGQFDFLMVNNNAILEGTLSVNLLGTFTPLLGNSFVILTTSLGQVDADTLVLNAPVVNDLTFDLIVNLQSIVLEVIEVSVLAGDYNDDGVVDAADYIVWRVHLGQIFTLPNEDPSTTPGEVTPEDYDVWRMKFGNTDGSGSLSSVAVPEPGGLALLAMGSIASLMRLRVKPKSIVRIESRFNRRRIGQ